MINKKALLDRFLKYVKIDTQVVPDAPKVPSSAGQFELARIVTEDMKNAGVQDVVINEKCYLLGTIPANPKFANKPVVGFLAHFDTAAEVSGKDVKPRIIENYQGQKITFTANPDMSLDPAELPALAACKGHTIITADGTTLLGGDCKAGIAAIVEMAQYFKDHPEAPHGKIRVCIIPDEESGIGAEQLDLKEFGVNVAYTVDGGAPGEIDVESFNGFKGKVTIKGNAAFPGYGKGVYLNAARVLSEFVAKMNDNMWPENCEGRQPIWWVDDFKGRTADAEVVVYLRNFDLDDIERQKAILNDVKKDVLKKFPKAKIDIDISKTYLNYKLELDKDKRVVSFAEEAATRIGLKPSHKYVRGGNDSCHLCFSGLISTNLFVGMDCMHSLREWMSLDVMAKASENLVALSGVWAEKG